MFRRFDIWLRIVLALLLASPLHLSPHMTAAPVAAGVTAMPTGHPCPGHASPAAREKRDRGPMALADFFCATYCSQVATAPAPDVPAAALPDSPEPQPMRPLFAAALASVDPPPRLIS